MFVVFLAIIYTYRVNREVNELQNHWGMRSMAPEVSQSAKAVSSEDVQFSGKIEELVSQLDEIIVDLRAKDAELTRIIEKARQWDWELADAAFTDILQKKMNYQYTTDEKATPLVDEVKASEEMITNDVIMSETETSSIQKSILPKYDQIIQLTDAGLSIAEIAQRLNLGHREVELVVKMKSKGADTDV